MAATYTNNGRHYQFDYPDNWTSGPSPGTDAVYEGPAANGVSPTVNADSGNEPNADDNNATRLLEQANASLTTLNASVTLTIVQQPRTFTTASGRLAADFVVERNDSGTDIRQRDVRFVSEFWGRWYVLSLSDNVSTYASHDANWTQIVDSFMVTGEPEIPAALAITVGGNNTTFHVDANVSVRFALNQSVPNGLDIEWFRNGTSVGTGDRVDLTFAGGEAVITVKISNATATRTLTKAVTTGTSPPTTPPPTGGAAADNTGLYVGLGIVALLAVVGIVLYLFVLRPKQRQGGQAPGETAPPEQPPRR